MSVIVDASDLITRLTGGDNGFPESFFWHKDPTTQNVTAGVGKSTWLLGGIPGPGSAPGAVSNPTSATVGAFRMLNPTGGRQRWLRSMQASCWTATRVVLYDRLQHMSGLSGTSVSPQSVGGSLTRYTGQASLGNIILAEVYTAIGATPSTVSCTYLDKDGASRTSGSTVVGAATLRNPGDFVVIPYNTADGANSVTSVTNATLSGTTGTAGSWGITIARPLLEIDIGAIDAGGFGHGVRQCVLENIEMLADACLGILFMTTGATINWIRGTYTSVEA